MNDPEHILEKARRGQIPLLPDEEAPPVDDALLLAFLSRRTSPEESKRVSLLLASYRCWRERYLALLLQPRDPSRS